jgi:long-chain acyl-CoA synthetase
MSNQALLTAAQSVALGLVELGLAKGDRVALLMHSDVKFCLVDMGCLIANLVNVPIDLTQTIEIILSVLQHSEAKALVISNLELLEQILPYLQDISVLHSIILADVPEDWTQIRSQWMMPQSEGGRSAAFGTASISTSISETACLDLPMALHPAHLESHHSSLTHSLPHSLPRPLPQCIQVFSLAEIQRPVSTEQLQALRQTLQPQDLATIIYIPDAIDPFQGVMLTHENLSANALAAFSGLTTLKRGAAEVVLSFLPLNHVFARSLLYGHIHYGHSIYFSNPNRVIKHLKEVQPTLLETVPLLLEKIYSKILETGQKSPIWQRLLFNGSLKLAKGYKLDKPLSRFDALLLKLADWLVLRRWRSIFGDRLRYIMSGGAALSAELATVFAAAGVMILQGYGLTQTSSVICYNRETLNRAGTVGVPMAGVEMAIAADGEIMVRAPYVMAGYYKNPAATAAAIDPQGWFHTGDLGSFSPDGFLTITGIKKALFKLSTGKYIVPQPIEARLMQSSFVQQAIVVGVDRKFCALLIVPNLSALHTFSLQAGIDLATESLLHHPHSLGLYQALIEAANCHLPYWAIVKRFRLISTPLTVENGLLDGSGQFDRPAILKAFAAEIAALYQDPVSPISPVSPAILPDAACPTVARSLNPKLTT